MASRFQISGLRNTLRLALLAALAAPLAMSTTGAQAALVISTGTTANVTCVSHVCTATASNAVLNTHKVQNQLASGNLKVVSGSVAGDVVVASAITWVSAHTLTLDSYHSITVNSPVSVTGTGGLTLTTNDGATGGTLVFTKPGHVNFWSLSSSLSIDGHAYTLVNTIATLASAIGSNPSGFYALAANYDATPDGIYASSPIATVFTGVLQGLGNAISHLKITQPRPGSYDGPITGLFMEVGTLGGLSGTIANLNLVNVNIKGSLGRITGGLVEYFDNGVLFHDFVSGTLSVAGSGRGIGSLVAEERGSLVTLDECSSSATVSSTSGSNVGGLIGIASGTIRNSYATGAVTGGYGARVGGLVGMGQATLSIESSYATGNIIGGNHSITGGLFGVTGNSAVSISNSYATGAVTVGTGAVVGGLIGEDNSTATVSDSYSTGTVSGGSFTGGFAGADAGFGSFANSYWDTTTSGITDLSKGVGGTSNDPGVTGLTTVQLQSGLPTGFSASVWGQNPSINGGLPYLLAIPPS